MLNSPTSKTSNLSIPTTPTTHSLPQEISITTPLLEELHYSHRNLQSFLINSNLSSYNDLRGALYFSPREQDTPSAFFPNQKDCMIILVFIGSMYVSIQNSWESEKGIGYIGLAFSTLYGLRKIYQLICPMQISMENVFRNGDIGKTYNTYEEKKSLLKLRITNIQEAISLEKNPEKQNTKKFHKIEAEKIMEDNERFEQKIAQNYECPVTGQLMEDPVTLSTQLSQNKYSYHHFSKKSIQKIVQMNKYPRNPITNHPIDKNEIMVNKILKHEILNLIKEQIKKNEDGLNLLEDELKEFKPSAESLV